MEFKQNKTMPAEKQIVTANPDVTTVRVIMASIIQSECNVIICTFVIVFMQLTTLFLVQDRLI